MRTLIAAVAISLMSGSAFAGKSDSPKCIRDLTHAGQLLWQVDSSEKAVAEAGAAQRCPVLKENHARMSHLLGLIRACMSPAELAEGNNYAELTKQRSRIESDYSTLCR